MATPNKTIDNERVIDALVGQESGGRYDAVNESYDKRRKKKVYAVGKYQIMDYNLPKWTRKHLGKELSVQEFLANPEAQDRVGRGQINEYYSTNLSRYNDPTLAAQETALDWYGRGTPSEGPHPNEYARQVLRRLGSNYERIASKPDTVALSSAIEEAKKKAPYGVVFVAGGKIRDYTGAEIGDVPTLGKVQADTSNEHEEAKKAVETLRSGGSAPITPSELNLDELAKYSPTGLKGGLTNLTPQLREVAKANLGLDFDVHAIKNELPPKPGVYELGDDIQPVDKFDAKANAERQAIRDSRKRLLKENANMLEPGDVVESKGELVDRVAPYEEQQKTYELQAKNAENIIDKGLFSLAASGGVGAGIAEGVVAAAEALPLVSQAMNSSDGFFGLTDDAAKEKALIWGKDWNRLDDTEKNRFRMLAKIDDQNALSSIKAPGKISTPLGNIGVSDAIRTTSGLASYLPVLGAGARTFAALGKNALPAAVIAAEFPDKAIEVAKGDKNVFEAVSELGIDAAGMRAIAPIMEKAIKVGEGAKTALGGQIKGGLTNIAGQTAVGLGQQAATALVQGRGNLSGEELGQNALTNIGLSLLDVRGGIKRARLQKDLEGYKRTAKPDIKTVGDDTYTKVDEVDGKVVVDIAKKDGTVERKEMPKKEWVLADTPHSFTSGKYVTDVPTVDHVISRGENKGKIVKGVLASDITGEQARAIDPYAFKKDNGYFIRLSHVERPEGYVAPDADIPTIGKLRKDFPGIQAAYSDLNGKPHMVVSKDMLAGLDGRDKVKAERALRKSGFEKIGNMFVYEYGDTLPSDFAPKQAPAEPKRIFDGYEFGIRQEGDKFIVEEGKNDIASFDDVDAAKGYVSKFEKIPEAKVDNSTSKEPTLVDNVVTKPEVLVDNVEPGNHGERLTKEFQEGMGYDQEKATSTVALLDAHASMLESRGLISKDDYLARFKVVKGGTPGEGALMQAVDKTVLHGTAFDFDAFSNEHIGKGEGAQAFGRGHYFTDDEGIARQYAKATQEKRSLSISEIDRAANLVKEIKDAYIEEGGQTDNPSAFRKYANKHLKEASSYSDQLSAQEAEAIRAAAKAIRNAVDPMNPTAKDLSRILYTANIKGEFVERNKSISSESGVINDRIEESFADIYGDDMYAVLENGGASPDVTFGELHDFISKEVSPEDAAQMFRDAGIDGFIYPADAGRREGKNNYVVFNPDKIQIASKELFQEKKGSIEFKGNERLIRGLEAPDASTGVHEISHAFLEDLVEFAPKDKQFAADLQAVRDWTGAGDNIETAHHEQFARGFENYLREGKSPSPELHGVFQRFARWLRDIYAKIKGSEIDIPISKEMNAVFDRLFVNKIINERVGNERIVVNPKDLQTHPDFQNRKEAFSKDTYDKIIAEGWNWDKYVPIKVWQDPKTNEYFTLNHTRRQAALDLGIDKLPVEVIEAKTFAEAKELARDSNNLGTPETPLERSGRYRDLWGTESNTSIDKKAKQNEGNNKELVLALSRLDPQSKALQDLQLVDKSPDRDSYNQIEKYAKWTGKLQSYFSEFTRKQQNEVYEYLRDNKDVKSFDVLRDFVQRAYDKAYFEGFDANKSLNLKQAKDIHPEELRFNEKLNAAKAEYEQAKKEFESKKELAIAQGINVDSHPAVLQSAEYLRTTENAYRDLLRNKADILSKIRGEEQNLFGDERADSRASGGKISSDMKAKLVDLVDKGEYNKNNLAVGDRVYMYSDGEGNTMPSIGVIKEIGGIPVFYDYKTKRSSPIDENVTRVGQPHPYTEKGGRAIPYVIAQMANRLAKSFDGVNDYGLFRSKKKFGYFQGDNKKTRYGKTFVAINKSIFVDPNQVAQTLAHEIGHLIDYAGPELPGFSKGLGKTTGLFTTNRGGLKNRIKTLVDNLPVLDSELRRELEALSTEWSPFDPAANSNFTKYRYSAKELYAEFVSALLNEDMALINRTAPKFYEAFMAKMAERPQVAEAYELLKADLDPNNPATWQAKLDNDLKVKAESNQHMRELRDEEKTSRKDVAKRPMQRFDYYSVIEKPLRDLERKAFDALKDAKVSEKERGLYLKAKQEIRDGVDVAANELLIAEQSSRLGEKGIRALALADKYIGESLYWHQGRTAVMNARLSPEAQAEIADKVESIFKPAREAGVDQYISSYLEQTAILGEHRKGKANPDFGNEFSAKKTLDAIKERIGDENYAVLEKAAKDFRDEQWRMLGEFKDAGLITEEQYLDLEKNADSYARFQSILDDNLKPFYSRKGVSGMLDATKDVAVTGTIQMMTMKHAMLLNKVKQTTVGLLGGVEAKVVNKNARTREERYGRQKYGQDVIDVYENGERKGYVVDQYVADIFNKAPFIVDKTWDWYTGWMNFQRTNLITLNAGWWMNNPIRDMMRLVKNVGFGALAEIPKSTKAAFKLQKGEATPLGDEAGKAGAINYRSRSSWIDGAEPMDKVLRSPDEKISGWQRAKNWAMKPLELGEAVNRLAGYSYARKKGMSPAEAAFHSRQFASTPDSSVSGYNSAKLNRAFMFSKMAINGAMSDMRILRNPSTQKGVIARAMITSIIPKVTQGLLAYGVLPDIADSVFGAESEEAEMIRAWADLYAAIPSYDLQRFTVVPTDLSYDKDGKLKVKYLRFADDPNYTSISNMVLGLVGKVAQGEPGEAITDVVDQWYQALPGAAPIIDASMAWFDYIVKGENPNDDFMKRDVVPIGEYAAVKGGSADERLISDAGKTMGLWTIQKIMGANYSLLKNTISGKDASWRFGVYADIPAYQTERKEVEGEARRESAEASLEANKVLDTKDVSEIEAAYNAGVLTEKQYKRGLKEAGMSDEELYLRDKPTKVLLALQAQAKHRGLNTDYELITKVLESRKKKSTFKGVGGNSGKSALLGK